MNFSCFFYVFFCPKQIQETWYEKLHDWDNALTAYEKKIDASPDDISLTMGRLRCLEALGEW